jgi:hypothetical protein
MIPNRPYTSVFIEEGGWTRYKQTPRANPANFVNKHGKKLGTLIYSARADRPAHRRGLSGPRTVRPQGQTVHPLFLVPNICPLPFGGAEQTKSN